ncbi:MAG: hypothetical protein JSR45_11845 [Proteobacteria bacterium]|nr:hypothetical protein [Pseudomonadota bacterium]
MANSRASKLRIRAVSPAGQPLANVRVELVDGASFEAVKAQALTGTDLGSRSGAVLASLRTSRDGFSIFSLDRLRSQLRPGADLSVRFGGRPELTFGLDTAAIAAGAAYFPYTLPPLDGLLEAAEAGPWVEDGIEPDDVTAIPSAFPDLGDLVFGDDYCGRLIPNDRTVRVFEHNYVVRTHRGVKVGTLAAGRGKGMGHVAFQTEADGLHIDEGDLTCFEIKWSRLGYTFGDLLYSLPLAPCESVSLAISHWEQDQSARAEQTSTTQQAQTSSYASRSAIAETMNALSNQLHVGVAASSGSSSGGGGSGSGVIYGMLLKATSAFQTTSGATIGASYDRSKFSSNATRDISNTVQQAAEAWRRDHQVVVMEQKETEDQQTSSRTVCNNNHCHVLNIFYHEVLCNHRVTTRLAGHREVYLIPYALMTFDRDSAACLLPKFSPFLLDPSLLTCSDAAPAAAPPAPKTVRRFRIELRIDSITRQPTLVLLRIVPRIGGPADVPVQRSNLWQGGYTYQYDVDTADYLPEDLRQIGVWVVGGGGGLFGQFTASIGSMKISMLDPDSGQWVEIASSTPGFIFGQGGSLANVDLTPPAAAGSGDCLDKLVAHLNCNAYYYNSLAWLLEDPNERIDRLDQIACGPDRLLDLVIPEPVAVMGHYVAFAKSGSDYEPYLDTPIAEDRLVVIPTPGVFADAALGRCSTCEVPDDTRYWDWSKTPCSCCGAAAPTLKTPDSSSLLGSASTTFPGYPSNSLLTNVVTSAPEAGSNGLVAAFGSALATAMMSGKGASEELGQLKDLLGKLTESLSKLAPNPGDGPPKAGAGTGDSAGSSPPPPAGEAGH